VSAGMTRGRSASRLGSVATGVMIVTAIALAGFATNARISQDPSSWILGLVFLATTTSYLVVGWLIMSRRPGNGVGPLVLALGLPLTVYVTLDAWIRQPDPPFGIEFAALVVSLIDGPMFFLVAMLFLFFPDGRIPARRWRWLVAITAGAAAYVLVGAALRPGPFPYYPWLENPLSPPPNGLETAWEAMYGLTVLCVAIAALSLIGRWRRAGLIERAQLKWVAAAAGVVTAAMITYGVGAGPNSFSEAGDFAVGVSLTLFPIAIGIAVLRYRLYEIDRLISRTIGWAVVTGVLVGSFVLLVLGLQAVLAPLTGGSTLAVAGSTLVVAALFAPVRSRVQRAVDRRFDRSRYDGERLLADFGERLRDEVDLVTISRDARATVDAAVRPTSVGLWLRGGSEGGAVADAGPIP
jgi:hypothetical protein